jgi:hypothetical protein
MRLQMEAIKCTQPAQFTMHSQVNDITAREPKRAIT